ncbi:sulfite exporter TauE/SafE family protein [Labilibacter marinus]|uniref:sulfite exporter TauE/SafE family protein n=1 Tax=Labilibacter marinus TaxID=1477105 RepID=UPI000830195A|nr:sulfite exporter TauE/SafE family protein [Labilibacter marinus]
MTLDIQVLITTAISAGFIHTILGPDHYLPFIMIGKARNWNITKILSLTFICGLGHVLSSVVLGLIGVFFGVGLEKLNLIEATRGNLAAWALIAFGLMYSIWGLRKVYKNKKHTHAHLHSCGVVHSHEHNHQSDHSHVHAQAEGKKITPWVLFIIFVLGPCEVLIPLLMYPAAQTSTSGMLMVTLAFGVSTLLAMMISVTIGTFGFSFIPVKKIGLYTHVIAGSMIFLSGLAIQILGI